MTLRVKKLVLLEGIESFKNENDIKVNSCKVIIYRKEVWFFFMMKVYIFHKRGHNYTKSVYMSIYNYQN